MCALRDLGHGGAAAAGGLLHVAVGRARAQIAAIFVFRFLFSGLPMFK